MRLPRRPRPCSARASGRPRPKLPNPPAPPARRSHTSAKSLLTTETARVCQLPSRRCLTATGRWRYPGPSPLTPPTEAAVAALLVGRVNAKPRAPPPPPTNLTWEPHTGTIRPARSTRSELTTYGLPRKINKLSSTVHTTQLPARTATAGVIQVHVTPQLILEKSVPRLSSSTAVPTMHGETQPPPPPGREARGGRRS